MPPFPPDSATRHNKKAKSAKSKRAYSHAAESVYAETGDEGRAIAAGNAAVNKSNAKTARERSGRR